MQHAGREQAGVQHAGREGGTRAGGAARGRARARHAGARAARGARGRHAGGRECGAREGENAAVLDAMSSARDRDRLHTQSSLSADPMDSADRDDCAMAVSPGPAARLR